MRGNRVQAIVRELSNERMDIINWTDELNMLVRRVFSPSELKRVILIDPKRLVVIVSDDSLAQAIGKEGQNIKLASKLIDKEIDIYGETEFSEFTEEQRDKILNKPVVPKTEQNITPVIAAEETTTALSDSDMVSSIAEDDTASEDGLVERLDAVTEET
jgi:N utilization substance protein A